MVKSEPVTPLGRPKATESLGGFGRTRTIVTPLDRHNANASFGDLADLNHSHTYWGLGRVRPW